jgi:hypothetical protein
LNISAACREKQLKRNAQTRNDYYYKGEFNMNADNEDIGVLTSHIKTLGQQLEVLAAKQHAVATTGMMLNQEFQKLREQQREAARQLFEIEQHQTGLYMWENIGCGG